MLQCLAEKGLQPEVCLEPDLDRVGQRVRAAIRAGCRLVIAAGGDGTIEAIAPMLVNTQCALGIIPLGTYNNIAASLRVPFAMEAACALLVTGIAHPIDMGQVRVRGAEQPHLFLEQATVGLGALLAPVGEDFEKGHWLDALRALPAAARLEPVEVQVILDDGRESWTPTTLLVTVCNAPRSAAAFVLAPDAKMDDGLFDVCVYDGLHQAELAARIFEFIGGGVREPGVRRTRAATVEVRQCDSSAGHDLLVAADAQVVGATPATFSVLPGALRVIVPRD